MTQESFWNNPDTAKRVMSKLTKLKGTVDRAKGWSRMADDFETALDFVEEEGVSREEQQSFLTEARTVASQLLSDLGKWEVEALLNGPYDNAGCRMYITAGVGGTDACDWANILLRMYQR